LLLGDVYTQCARLYPDRCAVIEGRRSLGFQEVNERAIRLASALRGRGLVQGDRVAILCANNLEYLECIGAAAKAALVLVPINFRLRPAEIRFLLSDSGARLVFAGTEFVPTLEEIRTDLTTLENIVVFGPAEPGQIPYQELLEHAPSIIEDQAAEEDDIVALMYTAAVGGQPRGAMMTHRSFVYQSAQIALAAGIGMQDVYLNMLPMFHTMDLSLALAFFHMGATNVILGRFDPAIAAALIEQHRVSFLGEFAPMAAQILNAATERGTDLSSVRRIFGLDSPDTVRAYLQRYPGLTWLSGYGQTETHGVATLGAIGSIQELDRRPGIPGRPGPLNLVRVVDKDDHDVAVGETGEIVVRGPNVAVGYWGLPDVTSYVGRNGWHHTGDVGRLDADGYLWFVGRKPEKDLIKTGGENVYPEEVEHVLKQHPDVREACVIGVADPEWSEAVKAVVICEPDASLTALDLIDFCRQRIASYKKPKHVEFVQDLPRTADGQMDRQAIKSMYGRRVAEQAGGPKA
jgi:long-chain acyl-CoA synthetase